jgi:hypothetical protein
MKITPLEKTGNSSKFIITLSRSRGEFMLSLSYTLCHTVWQLPDESAILEVATKMAEAIVGRHDPETPFKEKYIFGDHNTAPTVDEALAYLKKNAI